MHIKTVQWNIGGGKTRETDGHAYDQDGIAHIIKKLIEYGPEIVTLQEAHSDKNGSQAEVIASAIGLNHYINDAYDESHIDPTQHLCLSVLSRFPIHDHRLEFFANPHYRTIVDGKEWISHDKAIMSCVITTPDGEITVQNIDAVPFRLFTIDPLTDLASEVKKSIEDRIYKDKSPYLLQGDFNYFNIKALLPGIFINELQEAGGTVPTTPNDGLYDHILYRGFAHASLKVDSEVLTDHFALVAELSS